MFRPLRYDVETDSNCNGIYVSHSQQLLSVYIAINSNCKYNLDISIALLISVISTEHQLIYECCVMSEGVVQGQHDGKTCYMMLPCLDHYQQALDVTCVVYFLHGF